MSAALSRPDLSVEACRRVNRVPDSIDLGTCVRFNPEGGRQDLTEEGVVIEVVPAGQDIQTRPVVFLFNQPRRGTRMLERYVIQSKRCRMVRRKCELMVVSL